MAKNGASFLKRQKERNRQERQKQKAVRRAEVKQNKLARPIGAPGYDPDLEGIIPGPQPRPDEEG